MSQMPRWTRAELEECLALRPKMTWPEIGALYGTSGLSLRVTAWKYRNGKLKFAEDKMRERRAKIVETIFAGEVNARKIADEHGMTYEYCRRWLRDIGMPRVERDRYAAMADRVDTVSRV